MNAMEENRAEEKRKESSLLPILAILATVFFWGISFISIKVIVNEVPPFTMAALRMVVAAVILLVIYLKFEKDKKIDKKGIVLLALTGFVGTALYFALELPGIKYTTASNASMIVALVPVLAVIADRIFFKNRLSWISIIGIVISVVGTYFIIVYNGGLSFSNKNLKGDILMLVSDFCWVGYTMLNKYVSGKYSDLTITTMQNVTALLFMIPLVLFEHINWGGAAISQIQLISFKIPSTAAWINIIFLGAFCSAAAYFLYIYAVRKLGVTVTSVYLNLVPIVTVAVGFLVLGEKVLPVQLFGGAMIIAGVMLVEGRRK